MKYSRFGVAPLSAVFMTTVTAALALSLSSTASALTLDDALLLAERNAPVLAARRAGHEAARQTALPAGELPDPELKLGLQNVPISGDERGSLNSERMTSQTVGYKQQVTSRDKRAAREALADADIQKAAIEQQIALIKVRRDTAVAWISARATEQKLALFPALYDENTLLASAIRVRLSSGQGGPADDITPRIEAALLDEQRDVLIETGQEQRARLRRYIGAHADEALQGSLPDWSIPTPTLQQHLEHHPELTIYRSQLAQTEARIDTALAAKTPDWSWELDYHRRGREFGDMMSVQFSMDLPLFSGDRQDPLIAAARARHTELEAEREVALRHHIRELEEDTARYQRLVQSVTRHQDILLPLAEEKVTLQMAAYRAGNGTLEGVIAARRDRLDAHLALIESRVQRALVSARLYFTFVKLSREVAS